MMISKSQHHVLLATVALCLIVTSRNNNGLVQSFSLRQTATSGTHNRQALVSFIPSRSKCSQSKTSKLFSSSTSTEEASQVDTTTTTTTVQPPPSWEELEVQLEKAMKEKPEPLVTLYRDTNGWCPFCERVWLALHVKNIPYKESLVSLQNKPQWYKDLVPTSLVPAVLFHGTTPTDDEREEEETTQKNERRIVWESNDILKALDEEFPNHGPKLMLDDDEKFQEAMEMNDKLQSLGFKYLYGNTTDETELAQARTNFEEGLNQLDAALAEHSAGGEEKSYFRLGKEFTGIDAIMIPALERWRYQLPLTKEFDILENRPHLCQWFETMDSFTPYNNRVRGDIYSWTATTSMFLRYFGVGEEDPSVKAQIDRADSAATEIAKTFLQHDGENDNNIDEEEFALEAAAKLISNHEAVIADCTNSEPKSQQHIERVVVNDDDGSIDALLRYTSFLLLSSPKSAVVVAQSNPLIQVSNPTTAARAAQVITNRLCVPRDMGAPAAATLRSVLSVIANRLED